jgi:hypothetical protein
VSTLYVSCEPTLNPSCQIEDPPLNLQPFPPSLLHTTPRRLLARVWSSGPYCSGRDAINPTTVAHNSLSRCTIDKGEYLRHSGLPMALHAQPDLWTSGQPPESISPYPPYSTSSTDALVYCVPLAVLISSSAPCASSTPVSADSPDFKQA